MAINISKFLFRAKSKIEAESWEAVYNKNNPAVKTEIVRDRSDFIIKIR